MVHPFVPLHAGNSLQFGLYNEGSSFQSSPHGARDSLGSRGLVGFGGRGRVWRLSRRHSRSRSGRGQRHERRAHRLAPFDRHRSPYPRRITAPAPRRRPPRQRSPRRRPTRWGPVPGRRRPPADRRGASAGRRIDAARAHRVRSIVVRLGDPDVLHPTGRSHVHREGRHLPGWGARVLERAELRRGRGVLRFGRRRRRRGRVVPHHVRSHGHPALRQQRRVHGPRDVPARRARPEDVPPNVRSAASASAPAVLSEPLRRKTLYLRMVASRVVAGARAAIVAACESRGSGWGARFSSGH